MPLTKTLCQLCHRLVRIVSVPMPAPFKSECLEANCPINADCTRAGEFVYQVSFAEQA